jgi:sulfate transport system substrate-binding protein
MKKYLFFVLFLTAAVLLNAASEVTILNVSYDPTRELYQEYNLAFAKYWKGKTGRPFRSVSRTEDRANSRSVIDGLQADVVTLALACDIDQIAKGPGNTRVASVYRSQRPYTSTIVFLVRKKAEGHQRLEDLIRSGISVITQSQNIGWRALELSGCLGMRAQ